MNTELDRIAGLIEQAGEDPGTPLQQKLDAFGRILFWAALGIVALLFGLGLLRRTLQQEERHHPLKTSNPMRRRSHAPVSRWMGLPPKSGESSAAIPAAR
jgi:hypothetical protein